MKNNLTAGTKMAAVIKADGYGHGAVQIARLIHEFDYIWGFAVATPEEAMQLRAKGISKPIMLLGYAFEESYEDLIDYDIRVCVFEEETAGALSACANALGKTAIIHFALDTGMSRIGFSDTAESVEAIKRIAALPNIRVEGLFTHFARADELSVTPAITQMKRYNRFSEMLAEAGVEIPIHHMSNSAGIIRLQAANADMVRAGITVYGLYPSDEVETEPVPLKPVMSLISHISYVKTLEPGAEISYGGTYKVTETKRVATIPVGYADGYPRQLSNKGYVLIHGKKAPILGRVCMDQLMIDISNIDGVKVGDEVTVIGDGKNNTFSFDEMASLTGTINYELVCLVGKRVPRVYIHHGKNVGIMDSIRPQMNEE
jgi:alanine racemase